jgi:hypothetical protein
MKKCTKCKENKQFQDFPKKHNSKDGYHQLCKICINLRNKQYREKNREKFIASSKKYALNNREKVLKQKIEYSKKHKKEKALYDIEYRKNNKEMFKKAKIEYELRNKDNPIFKIKRNLRRRIHHVVANGYKSVSSEELLGCTGEEYKKYLESKFKPGMTWDNYGPEWHIDHIIPCNNFNLLDQEEQKRCFHYTNTQPLWKEENLKKGRKLPKT